MEDCNAALRLDDASIKGHYLLGVALDAHARFDEAARHLYRALELCKERTISYKEDIQRAMLATRKRQWQAASAASDVQIGTAERLLPLLVRQHYEDERRALRESAGGESARAVELNAEAQSIEGCACDAITALRRQRGPGRVPDYFCCKITMEVMLDPVVTPDGITYERSALLEHLRKVGRFDPVTRRDISEGQLSSNLALKEAINAYLEENPWAYDSPT